MRKYRKNSEKLFTLLRIGVALRRASKLLIRAASKFRWAVLAENKNKDLRLRDLKTKCYEK